MEFSKCQNVPTLSWFFMSLHRWPLECRSQFRCGWKYPKALVRTWRENNKSYDFCFVLPSRSWTSRAIASRILIERKREELKSPAGSTSPSFSPSSSPRITPQHSPKEQLVLSNSHAMCCFEHSYSGIFQERANRRACFVGAGAFEALDKSFYAGIAAIELS